MNVCFLSLKKEEHDVEIDFSHKSSFSLLGSNLGSEFMLYCIIRFISAFEIAQKWSNNMCRFREAFALIGIPPLALPDWLLLSISLA